MWITSRPKGGGGGTPSAIKWMISIQGFYKLAPGAKQMNIRPSNENRQQFPLI